jgi:hypothetical protein
MRLNVRNIQRANSDEFLYEQLRDVRRRLSEISHEEINKTRKHLLLSSTIGFAVAITGAVPTKIEAIGVEFSQVDRFYFFAFIGLIVLYFLAKFLVDHASLKIQISSLLREENHLLDKFTPNDMDTDGIEATEISHARTIVIVFEYVVPLLIGLAAIVSAFFKAFSIFVVQHGGPLFAVVAQSVDACC